LENGQETMFVQILILYINIGIWTIVFSNWGICGDLILIGETQNTNPVHVFSVEMLPTYTDILTKSVIHYYVLKIANVCILPGFNVCKSQFFNGKFPYITPLRNSVKQVVLQSYGYKIGKPQVYITFLFSHWQKLQNT